MVAGGQSPTTLYRQATRAAILGLAINLALGVVKLAAGLAGNAFALVSDAVNSFGDALTSAVVLVALRFAQKPADDEHPYGHTRAEAVAASSVALVLLFTALQVGWEAVRRLPIAHDAPAMWTLWVAGGNAALKELLYHYKRWVAHRTGSAVMLAHAWDHRSDALCSLAVLVGIGVVLAAGPAFHWADDVAALVIVGAILWTGAQLFRGSLRDLMDPQADPELVQAIRDAAGTVAGVRAVEKLWVRKTGMEYLADLHLQVDASLTVDQGHRIGHHVKDELLARFDSLRDVLVHLEPFPHTHQGNLPS